MPNTIKYILKTIIIKSFKINVIVSIFLFEKANFSKYYTLSTKKYYYSFSKNW